MKNELVKSNSLWDRLQPRCIEWNLDLRSGLQSVRRSNKEIQCIFAAIELCRGPIVEVKCLGCFTDNADIVVVKENFVVMEYIQNYNCRNSYYDSRKEHNFSKYKLYKKF